VAINGIHTSGVPGVDVPLDTDAVRFDFFLAWARRMGMTGCPRVFACELHAALVCAFHLDAPPPGPTPWRGCGLWPRGVGGPDS
jgi:hypothetical protein